MFSRIATLAVGVLALAATPALCQLASNQSAPFALRLQSEDKTIDGRYLYACHAGAALEALCVGGTYSPVLGVNASYAFAHNTTLTPTVICDGAVGVLTYSLPVSGLDTPYLSESMSFQYWPGSNVAVPYFTPGYEVTEVSFDEDGDMFVAVYVDDSQFQPATPPTGSGVFKPRSVYSWWTCWTYTTGYYYLTLAWVSGCAEPRNPTCVEVEVVRQFLV